MTASDDLARQAYAFVDALLAAAHAPSAPLEKYTYLSLALRAALHPQLFPFRTDPLRTLNGRYLSLDAQVAALEAVVKAEPDPLRRVGTMEGVLYLPGSGTARTCRIQVAYLKSQPGDQWKDPVAVHSVSPDLESAATIAFHAALNVLLFVAPGDYPPVPAPILWGVDGVEDAILEATAGESLQLPLTLALLSALTGLPIAFGTGATGAITPPDRVVAVGFLAEKRQAFHRRWGSDVPLLSADDGDGVAQIAVKLGEDWHKRFSVQNPPSFGAVNTRGLYAFVWAEVENAPILWATSAGDFRSALVRYESLFVAAMTRHRGEPFALRSGTAEGMGAVFCIAEDAVQASLYLLRSVRSAIWKRTLGNPLPIRIGIHCGAGEPFRETWRGAGPAQAIRIAQAASGGQILSDEAIHFSQEGGEWIFWGSHRLRDLVLPVPLWQVTVPDLATVDIAPASLETHRQNLPVPESPLIGREAEMTALVALLQQKRLVTLTGPGGVGKTRLAIAVAARVLLDLDCFPDGAYYVSLDAVSDKAIIARRVCEATGVRRVADFAAKRLLLILDNAEGSISHVTPLIQSILSDCPNIVLLITSRRSLRLREEKRYIVAPLTLPPGNEDDPDWSDASAVRLFRECASHVDDSFTIAHDEDRQVLSRLLYRLDGLPLAIELAAARTRYLSLAEIDDRLARSFRLLSTRNQSVPKRQQTLLATLEWSYDLLSAAEKALLRRVSVFVGGFDAIAAEYVMGDASETLDLLASLEEQSLLVRHHSSGIGTIRFSLLQTILDFAAEKRCADPEEDNAAHKAHAHHFLQLSDRYGGKKTTRTDREAESFDVLEREMANLRTAWNYFQRVEDTTSAYRFAANLSDFLRRRGYTSENLEWVETSLAYSMDDRTRQRLLHSRAMSLMEMGNESEAERVVQALQSLSDQDPDTSLRGDARALRGTIATRFKRFADAELFFDEAEKLYHNAGNKQGIATICNNRAVNALRQGRNERAWELSVEAQQLCHAIGDEHGEAYAHNNLGYLKNELGEYQAAEEHYYHQLKYCRSRRDTMGCAVSLFNIGEALLHQHVREGFPLLMVGTELLMRLGHSYAEPAQTAVRSWAEKTNTTQSTVDALRRTVARRTVTELRDTPIPVSRRG